MNTRRVKVWTTEDQIIHAIEHAHRKAESLVIEENELLKECSELFGELEKTRFEFMRSDLTKGERTQLERKTRHAELVASKAKAKAEAKAKAYVRVMEKTLPRLGEILAAFRTRTMEGVMGNYRGVAIK